MSEDAAIVTRKQAERADRNQRSAAALRDNLRRRKDQARARAGPPAASRSAASAAAAARDDHVDLSPATLSSKTSGDGGTTAD